MANIASQAKIDQRREQILQAAINIFAQKGFHSTNIADIASELKIGHGTIYRYYKNKRDIFDAIINHILEQLANVVTENPPFTDSLDDYRQQLINISNQLLGIFHQDPRLAQVLFYESMGVDRKVIKRIDGMMALFAKFTEAYLINGQSKQFLRENMDIDVAASIVTNMIFGAVKAAAIGQLGDKEIDRWRDEIIRFMIAGLGRGAVSS